MTAKAMESQGLLEDDDTHSQILAPVRPARDLVRWQKRCISVLAIFLLTSLLGNFASVLHILRLNREQGRFRGCGSKWANLTPNITRPIYASTQYGPGIGTQEERDAHWAAIDISPGIVAIPDAYAHENGLPLSQRFPWDQTQGVYILGAFHQIHCLQEIQKYTSSAHRGVLADNYHHVEHCLDTLLQDVRCHADDLPWYELPGPEQRQLYAKYQTRQCKSWDALLAWAKEYDACYRYSGVLNQTGDEVENQFEHYSYCSSDSPHWLTMKQFFDEHGISRAGYDS